MQQQGSPQPDRPFWHLPELPNGQSGPVETCSLNAKTDLPLNRKMELIEELHMALEGNIWPRLTYRLHPGPGSLITTKKDKGRGELPIGGTLWKTT
ncbi:unnamed protein product [Ranitomeya imitator]|uniref:Uncharacterized protein n=1 Tax=Ranitomeya imitator TaxID=111125 RepID=A0ABN9KUF4_9NEOB|nr:unnamed protein product [Ranitomeya imitator]